jgi:Family of unknown function (DUF6114)
MTRAARWRAWRRSRPFWGGLLLILAGLELVLLPLSGVLVHGGLKLVIYIGIGGVFGVLIGALLIAAGTALLVNPEHRTFYGIAGVVLGFASFPASNLGGFFLGMLLALGGGLLGYAWSPITVEGAGTPESPGPARESPGAGQENPGPGPGTESAAAS